MAVTRVDYDFKLKVTKTIDVGVSGAENPVGRVETATKMAGYIDQNTTPASKSEWISSRTITATSEQLNLAALTYGNLPTVDFTTGSYRVQFTKIVCSTANTTGITIQPSTANGYNIFGTTQPVTIPEGGAMLFYGANKLAQVAAGARLVSVTATTSGQSYDIQLVAG